MKVLCNVNDYETMKALKAESDAKAESMKIRAEKLFDELKELEKESDAYRVDVWNKFEAELKAHNLLPSSFERAGHGLSIKDDGSLIMQTTEELIQLVGN